MKPWSRFRLGLFLLSLALVTATGGCLTAHNNITRRELPQSWRDALQRSVATPAALAGTYVNQGELLYKALDDRKTDAARRLIFSVQTGRASLASVAGYPPPTTEGARDRGPAPTTVELIVTGTEQLEMIVRAGTGEVARRSWNVTWDAAAAALVLKNETKTKTKASGDYPGAAVGWESVRLFKGADGALYLQDKHGVAMALAFVIPIADRYESWSRWQPIETPR